MTVPSPLLPSLDEAVARFDPSTLTAGAAAAEQQRADILRMFPLADWPTMPVERYAVGMGDDDTPAGPPTSCSSSVARVGRGRFPRTIRPPRQRGLRSALAS